ncbi:DCC1-like thiol-disulfide oxidoreductase family protein [Marinobacter mobilis]|uniref:Predicted thiol-disulfide oxidoreductase YuxK, DCC family n=1 Tax=Marinobacter mobilis TaxID=488533 RepID=A0A1H2WMQ9_9GAMM|nr:DCC1-like thiol-disulfide oxidoreductase family protein [Marinobacter mobilis]SDW81544.1 Predicted thiol-disulfide oxidoreductase YuxK, DCC family [Marinobacter mobilis]
MTVTREILLVYDRECPACDNYCRMVRIRRDLGELKLVDAREHSEVMAEITGQGLDIDQGMVLKLDGQLYYGADAIHALALISSRSGFFNRLNFWLFRSRRLSAVSYPLLRWCRNLLLKWLGKTRINNLEVPGRERF